jgi:site-specific DNA-cytosine methylase
MSCVLRYADKHKPEIIVVENVVEVTTQTGLARKVAFTTN